MVGRHDDADENYDKRPLLQLCCNNALSVMNTFLQHGHMQKYVVCRASIGQRSLIGLCIVSADLFCSVLDVREFSSLTPQVVSYNIFFLTREKRLRAGASK